MVLHDDGLEFRQGIGDQINKKILRPLEEANHLRIKADVSDDAWLGQGLEKVNLLTNLIGIFESKDLDFWRWCSASPKRRPAPIPPRPPSRPADQ